MQRCQRIDGGVGSGLTSGRRRLHTRVEHADRVDARIGAKRDRQEAATRLPHHGHLSGIYLAGQR